MFSHLANHHPIQYAAVIPHRSVSRKRVKLSSCQPLITNMATYDKKSEKVIHLNNLVVDMLTCGLVPMSAADHPVFRALLHGFDPKYQLPSTTHFARKAIPERYASEKERITGELNKVIYISLTTDGWTSVAGDPYLSLTAHYVDVGWNLQTVCLHTMYAPGSHTGDYIAQFVRNGLLFYGLNLSSVAAVTTDNAANMVSAGNKLPCVRLGCFGHILHNAVTNALNAQEHVKELLVLSRRIVSTFSYSPLLRGKLKKVQKDLDLPFHTMVHDVSTRWSSIYRMLERLLEQYTAISQIFSEGEIDNCDFVMNLLV